MKKSVLMASVLLYTSVFAVEGYKDIYIESNKDIYVHTIYCAKNLNSLAKLKPSVVYTNTENIEKGTYYIGSAYGNYSTTFNKIKGQSNSLRVRGTLTKGQTLNSQMKQEICLVDSSPKFPKALNRKIKKDIVKSDDSSWNRKMKKYTNYFGKPASARGEYLSIK